MNGSGKIQDFELVLIRETTNIGEAIRANILKGDYPFKNFSILGAAFERKIPVTVYLVVLLYYSRASKLS